MTIPYVVEVEIDRTHDEELVDQIMNELAEDHVVVGGTDEPAHLEIVLTLEARGPLEAAMLAVERTRVYGTALGCNVTPEALRDERAGFLPDVAGLVAAPEAARELKVTRQGVHWLASNGQLHALLPRGAREALFSVAEVRHLASRRAKEGIPSRRK